MRTYVAPRITDKDLFRCGGCSSWRVKGAGPCNTCRIRAHRIAIRRLQEGVP